MSPDLSKAYNFDDSMDIFSKIKRRDAFAPQSGVRRRRPGATRRIRRMRAEEALDRSIAA